DLVMFFFTRLLKLHVLVFFFFFQAEDGIRDLIVTGVQTCALPIYLRRGDAVGDPAGGLLSPYIGQAAAAARAAAPTFRSDGLERSEERRVGKEWRCRWSADD